MLRIAFSTVATHDWPLDRVMAHAEDLEFDAVELRTFGSGSTRFACDPALTDEAKIRRLAGSHGVSICCVATGLAFDQRVHPPVIGRVIGDFERPLRDAKRAIGLAAQIDCPYVRVFGFQVQPGDAREKCVERMVGHLLEVLDAARNTGVRTSSRTAAHSRPPSILPRSWTASTIRCSARPTAPRSRRPRARTRSTA